VDQAAGSVINLAEDTEAKATRKEKAMLMHVLIHAGSIYRLPALDQLSVRLIGGIGVF